MIANFYIVNETFKYPTSCPNQQEIEEAIKDFVLDFRYIRENKETDKVYYNEVIFSEIIFPKISIEDFYNSQEMVRLGWDKDVIGYLLDIWNKAEYQNFDLNDILKQLHQHSQEKCFGLMGLHPVNSIGEEVINDIFLIYNKRNWLEFRRYFLGLYPKDAAFFIDECFKYFPELFFHEQNKESIKKVLTDFSKKIVYYLSCLNDKFKDSNTSDKPNQTAILEHFSSNCNFDSKATLEGKNKDRLYFDFIDDKGKSVPVCCEPHLKFNINDKGEATSLGKEDNHKRIYFHMGLPNIQSEKILVAHIGEHL